MSKPGCPVDHNASTTPDACPIDHTSSSTWSSLLTSSRQPQSIETTLSTERETSSIPKPGDGNWVYPSEAQFFVAMARKNHNPQAVDMKSIIPIHNIVNERAWAEILKWETGRGGEACGGIKLINFKGKAGERSPKARWNTLLGFAAPFDRHDWVVDRCGTRMRYVIDFYTGHIPKNGDSNLSFYLDVRPALDSWEGVKMRMEHFFQQWVQ